MGYGLIETFIPGLWECKIVWPLENSLTVTKMLNTELSYDPAIPHLGV